MKLLTLGLLALALAGPVLTSQPAGTMEQRISALVREFRGVMGVAAMDLRSRDWIAVNADARFPTASTIKVAVMLEAHHQAAEGRLPMDAMFTMKNSDKVGGTGVMNGLHEGASFTTADLIHLMIVLSDNTATNMLIERLGTARVNERLEGYGIRDVKLFRPTFRDGRPDVLPDFEREFGLGMATPRDMVRLMALIWDGKAVNRQASDAMLATLRDQQDLATIPRLLPDVEGLRVANKTGIDAEKLPGPDGVKRHVRADVGIVSGPNFAYAVAIYARQIEDTRWGVDNEALVAGGRISLLLFEHFSGKR